MTIQKNVEVIKDMVEVRLHNFPKLFSKEDFFNFHKIIGFLSLFHYIYRFYLFIKYESMLFDDSVWTLLAILLHTILSVSSLIFKIPERRIQSGPMIYPEFRLHSIIFALRSLVTMTVMFIARKYNWPELLMTRGLIVLGTMYLADKVTAMFKDQGTTMRAMPFPDYVTQTQRDYLNYYYSVSQIFATGQILFAVNMESVFLVLFPIQIAAFLMTCVRKSIISAAAWHYYYALSLGMNYIVCPLVASYHSVCGTLFFPVTFSIMFLRFNVRWLDKYTLWSAGMLSHCAAILFFNMYRVVCY